MRVAFLLVWSRLGTILTEIVKLVIQDILPLAKSPETQPVLYTTNSGEPRRYWPWSRFIPKEIRDQKNWTIHILNLSLTCARLSLACKVIQYHTVDISGITHPQLPGLHGFLRTITRDESADLQQYVIRLAVTSGFDTPYEKYNVRVPWRMQEIQKMLESGAVRLPVLRTLSLTQENAGWRNLEPWFRLLSTFPALEHLTLKGFQLDGREFPRLPRLKAVHFCGCHTGWPPDAPRSLLEKLPSLRSLSNFGSFSSWSPDTLEPVRDTLETLAWGNLPSQLYGEIGDPSNIYGVLGDPDITCLRQLRHLKAGFSEVCLDGVKWELELWNSRAIAGMESLETVEVIPGYPNFFPVFGFVPWCTAVRDIADKLIRTKSKGGLKSLRIVDLRALITGEFTSAGYKEMKGAFLDTAIRECEQLGIELLVPEIVGFWGKRVWMWQ
ncbi:hypothetical protein LX36DRAFT_681780 [Colletotrichum falcatum]|nr:hypothetical protein LX36DRAFT_681780 [Colletotrichum falcatum]